MEKICTKCGNEYSKDIKYCVRCGSNLVEKKIEQSPQNEQPLRSTSQQEMQIIKPSRTFQFKKTSFIEKIVIPAVIIAIILSIAAIALPFVLEENNLASNSVGTNEIKNNSVTGGKILDGTITNDDISNIGLSKFSGNSINSQMILDGTIDTSDLSKTTIQALTGLILIANNSITGNKILDGTIDSVDIKNDSITSGKIADGTITNSDIGSGAVNTDEIVNNSVTYDKMYIKIKYGKKLEAYNGTAISHGLGKTPISVIVTPIYDKSVLSGAYAIYANVYNINTTSFTIGLWYITFDSPPVIHEISGAAPFTSGVSVNWIAMV
jgi:predicted  nucleic acid-binding Zn-ribbon protein